MCRVNPDWENILGKGANRIMERACAHQGSHGPRTCDGNTDGTQELPKTRYHLYMQKFMCKKQEATKDAYGYELTHLSMAGLEGDTGVRCQWAILMGNNIISSQPVGGTGQPSCTPAIMCKVHRFDTENSQVSGGRAARRPRETRGPAPRWRPSGGAFRGSASRRGQPPPGPARPPRIRWGQRARRGAGDGERRASPPGSPLHTLPQLAGSPFSPGPHPPPPQVPSPSPEPSPSPPRPAPSPPPPSRSCPTSAGRRAWGLAPSPARLRQRWRRVAVSLPRSGCRCQGATGLGGLLAPADGGEVRVGGRAHGGRNAGGCPRLPPTLPAVSEGWLPLPLPPAPRARRLPGLVRKRGAVMGGPARQSPPRPPGGSSRCGSGPGGPGGALPAASLPSVPSAAAARPPPAPAALLRPPRLRLIPSSS